MKKIIFTPTGRKLEFNASQILDFQCALFAVLAGVSKKVTLTCDESVDYDEVYVIQYA